MKMKRLILLFLLITAVVVSCQPETVVETVVQEVEVTRIVTETVIQEGEPVEVTRQVTVVEEVVTEIEVPADSSGAPASDPNASVGSEVAGSAPPPPPSTGPKVVNNSSGDSDAPASTIPSAALEDRSGSSDSSSEAEDEAASTEALSDPTTISDPPPREDDLDLLLDNNDRLTAGEVDDNAQWDDYLLYLRNYSGAAVIEINISERHQIWVQNSQERPILGARIDVEANGQNVTTLRTHSNGLAYFFPSTLDIFVDEYTIHVTVNDIVETFTMPVGGANTQREWFVTHAGGDELPKTTKLDIFFVIDATGSMSDEINELKNNILAISAQIDALPAQPDVRFGMVAYRDQGEAYVTRVFDFTPDVQTFAQNLETITADGGGDYPEDLNEALFHALNEPEWRIEETVSLIFLVADAPPHLDYAQDNTYATEIVAAAKRGIKIYPIASSGLDAQGEYIFRQIAQYTGGRFIFLTYGEDGPGTPGTETTLQVTDYTVSALDALVIQIVEEELAYRIQP